MQELLRGDHRVLLAALIGGSIVFQLALLLLNVELKFRADEMQYLVFSRSIEEGNGLPGSLRPPVYPYAVAFARWMAPEGTPPRLAVGTLQIVASAIAMGMLYLLARELFDRRSGRVAAGVFGFYPAIAAHTHLLWSDSLILLPLVAGLLLAVRARKTGRYRTALASGAVFGGAALTREYAFWFVPVVSVWFAVASGVSRRRALAGALVLAGALLVVLPWSARNYRVHDSFVLIATNSWTPLYHASDVNHSYSKLMTFYQRYGARGAERERVARARALQNIAARQPQWIFERLGEGAPALLSLESFPLRHLRRGWYGDVPRWVRVVVVAVTVTSYLTLLVCFAFGVVATRWNPDRLLVLFFMLFAAVVVMPFPVVSRYRLPLEALSSVFAAAWLARAEATRGRLDLGPRFYCGVAIVAALVSLALVGGAGRIAKLLG